MNHPTPAIVTQRAARPLPRWALLLLCLAYVVPGFVGRDPWRNVDVASFGYMLELAQGRSHWLAPTLAGFTPDGDGLLAFWLGALALQWAPSWLAPEMAARLPFIALLVLTLLATWYTVYYLARSPGAQPVAFAFGGEAHPKDYARSMADAGLLALLACLGLAQLSHEITSYLAQLACTALVFFAAAIQPYHPRRAAVTMPLGMAGLVLAGAPTLATLLGLGCAALAWWAPAHTADRRRTAALAWAAATLASMGLAWALDLWAWRIEPPQAFLPYATTMLRMLVWFGWPAWPLALWTLWRWRRQIASRTGHRHLWLPLWFTLVTLAATFTTQPADRALLLGLPALAVLAAFALPTLERSIAALIDWFTLLFFSVSAIAIWVVWISLHTGIPAQPAANVARLAPGFIPRFDGLAFVLALAATAAWCALVWWRAARHRTALWKSLVLPASGTTLAWLLLMTIWLPMLDYARSYAPQVRQIVATLGPQPGCVLTHNLGDSQVAALQFHGHLALYPASAEPPQGCQWLAVGSDTNDLPDDLAQPAQWLPFAAIGRPTNRSERILLLKRLPPASDEAAP